MSTPAYARTTRRLATFVIAFVTLAITAVVVVWAETQPTAQSLPYTQDFSTLLATSTTYPAGWQGWQLNTGGASTSFRTNAGTADLALTASSSASTNAGGVHNYNGKIGFLQSGSSDPSIALALNTTGASNIKVSYDIMTIRNPYDGTTNTRINEATLQFRVGTSGSFTSLSGVEYQNNTTTQTGSGVTTPQNSQTKSIVLPASCDNQAVVQIRWAARDVSGGGGRPSFAVDNISVQSVAASSMLFRSRATGNWNASSTWEISTNGGTTYTASAGQTPTSSNGAITIQNGHNVTVSAAVSADELTVNSGGTVTVSSGQTLTINDGTGTDLTNSGTLTVTGTLATSGIASNGGTATINGAFQINQGGFASGTNFTYGAASTLIFNNSSGSYGVNNDAYWPAASGPPNVNVAGAGGITLNVARTVSGLFQTAAGVSNAGNLTIGAGGTFQLNTGGFVSGSPTYSATSTLKYNTGGSYGRAGEWLPGATGGAGYPHHVQLSNSTTLNLPNGSNTQLFQMAGNLTVDNGSTLSMGAMTQPLSVRGNVVISGNVTLSTALGGDLKVGGNYAASNPQLTRNGRAVFFDGTAAQTISSAPQFDYILIQNTSAPVTASGAIMEVFNNLSVASGATFVSTFTGGFGSLNMRPGSTINNSGAISVDLFVNNSSLNLSGVTINTVLQMHAGSSVTGTGPTYAATSTLLYTGGNTFDRGAEWSSTSGAGYPAHVRLQGGSTLNVGANGGAANARQVSASLQIENGSTFQMAGAAPMTAAVTVLGDLYNNGTISLSTQPGGDLRLGGNYVGGYIVPASPGSFNANAGRLHFVGTGTQTITNGSVTSIALPSSVVNKAGGTVQPLCDLNVGADSSGSSFAFQTAQSTLSINGRTISFGGTVGSVAGSGFIGSASAANVVPADALVITGSGDMGSLPFASNAVLGSLSVNRTGAGGNVTLGSSLNARGSVNLTAGTLTTGANTFTVGSQGTVTRASGYVLGTLEKLFGAAGSFTFDVGTANGYSPLDANVTAGAGSLSVKPTQSKHPNVAGTNALARFWTLNGSGITANLTFHYLAGDVAGTESNYKIFKYTGGSFTQFEPTALDTTNHTATLNGVSSFSDWTLAEAASVFGSHQFSASNYDDAETDAGTHNVTVTVQRTGGSAGAVSVHYATSDGTATAGSDYAAASGDLNWADGDVADKTFNVTVNGDASVEPDETINLTLSAPTGGSALGTPSASTITIQNDDTVSPLAGTKTVCASGCDYANLTGASGLFAAVNAAGLSGNLSAQVAGDLVEDGANALNQWTETGAGNYTLSIVPADGTNKTVSGAVAAGMIRLNGADRVNIDGRFGGAGRFLTFRNTHPAGATVALTNDATNNTLRSSVIEGAANALGTGVVFFGSGVTTGNDNNTVNDNRVRDRSDAAGVPLNLILSSGTAGAASNSNNTVSDNELFNFLNRGVNVSGLVAGSSESWTVTGNNVYQTAARTGSLLGISVGAAGSNTITGNTVHDLTTSGPLLRAINFVPTGSGTSNIARNRVYSLNNTTAGNTETSGLVVSPQDTTTVNVSNNMLSVVPSGSNDQGVYGFYEQGVAGTTVNFSYNSVLVGGTSTGASPSWACARNTDPTASISTWRDNVCFNNRTGGGANHFAAGNQSTLGTFSSDYNVFVGTGATASDFMDYGTDDNGTPVSFAAWQSSTGGDAHSLAATPGGDYTVANMFTSPTDLHLNTSGTNPASNAGTPLASVTVDYDNETRDTVIPDIGADEVAGATTLQFSSATYSVGEGAGNATINVTRTGSSVGAVAVQYVTSDGTASAGNDYDPLSDGLVWADGDTSPKTILVPVNDDALYEANETFLVTLNAPSGATLGTPSVATVTINDNDTAPTVSVGDVTVAEPSSGITYAVFPVTLSAASGLTTTVNFATADGTATQPGDYASANGTVIFAAGETSKTVAVIVKADALSDTPETFSLSLSSPSNATVADGTGVATISAPVGAGTVLINEFRLRGPGDPNSALFDQDVPVIMGVPGRKGGRPVMDTSEENEPTTPQPPVVEVGGDIGGGEAPPFPPETDEFVEIYNNTDADIVVTDSNPVTCAAQVITVGPTQACGWALVDLQGSASGGIPRFVIPVGTIIPARGHYLAASTGYSLSGLAAPDQTYDPPAYSGGEADYTGLALFKTADRAQFTPPNAFDAVGFDGVATPFREGSGLLPLTGVTEDVQFSFVRNQTSSRPSDTGDNRADFTLVATTPSLLLSGTATLGAPGPENLSSPVSRNSGFAVTIPPGVTSSLRNNTTVSNGSLGTLSLRRRFTNNTGQTLSRLRFRVVQVTTYNSKQLFSNQAEMRLLNAQLAGLGGTGLLATTVETPPNQTGGGGVNSGLLVSGSLTLAQPLASGQSVDVEFLLGVMNSGSYQFVVVVEGAQ